MLKPKTMHKPLLLLIVTCCAQLSYSQKTDTLILFYKSDESGISKADRLRLDSFLVRGWDKVSINGYTDETDSEEYNLELSKKRSGKVYEYLLTKNWPANTVSSQYFGESMPRIDNSSDDGRALNRRTEIVGYQFARPRLKPVADPMLPVTRALDNGFIITYRPGSLPGSMAATFDAGSGMNFQLIRNTTEMRQNNFYNNTTRGEILSSVLIICGNQMDPCKIDSPVLIRVPVPEGISCPIEKVKFFNAQAEKGKRIWQEENKQLYPEMIGGRKYIGIWMDNFCQCINFDFKVDPDCFDTDSTQVQFVNANIRALSAEIKGLNSVYLPGKISDSLYKVLFLKNKLDDARINFALYSGRRRVRSFRDQPLTSFPYDDSVNSYVLSSETLKFYFPRLKVDNVVLKVNNDKYRITPDKNKYEFVYLNRSIETILVDFTIIDGRGRTTQFTNQPIKSLPYDKVKGFHVIDRKFIKELKQAGGVARM
jgi:hypothetical protein